MKRLLATAAVAGVSLFGVTAVAGAAPGAPNPNDNAIPPGVACTSILEHNQAINLRPTPMGIYIFEGVGYTFGCFPS